MTPPPPPREEDGRDGGSLREEGLAELVVEECKEEVCRGLVELSDLIVVAATLVVGLAAADLERLTKSFEGFGTRKLGVKDGWR